MTKLAVLLITAALLGPAFAMAGTGTSTQTGDATQTADATQAGKPAPKMKKAKKRPGPQNKESNPSRVHKTKVPMDPTPSAQNQPGTSPSDSAPSTGPARPAHPENAPAATN